MKNGLVGQMVKKTQGGINAKNNCNFIVRHNDDFPHGVFCRVGEWFPFPFGFGFGVPDLGAFGDFLTPPLSPISAAFTHLCF